MLEKRLNQERDFIPLNIAILTVSDTRTEADDISGLALVTGLTEAGHKLGDKKIVPDDIYQIRAIVSQWIADSEIQIIISTGGTGVTGRDGTPEAVTPLLDKLLDGFGEVFRMVAGVANGTYIVCRPGSSGACRTAWQHLIKDQLDYRTRPCNLVQLIPRLLEK